MLIVVTIDPANIININLFCDGESIRNTNMKLKEYTPSQEKIRNLVIRFCKIYVSKNYIVDSKMSQCVDELSTVSTTSGLRIWENNKKKKWGLKE